jgi:hypothetical protein
MTPSIDRAAVAGGRRRAVGVVAVVLALSSFGLTGCSIVGAVRKVAHDVSANRATINIFTAKLKSSAGTTFAATYITTGANPTTVVYAVKPPTDVAFRNSVTGSDNSGGLDLIVNSSGAYSCTPPAGTGWTCQKLGTVAAATRNQILDFYTPSHWVAFLKGFALAAGFAGDKVTTSTMSVNGFAMDCVDFVAAGIKGTSTICSTSQGILGYVKVAQDSTTFEIKSYTSSPSPSLFVLPPGAKVTTGQNGNG